MPKSSKTSRLKDHLRGHERQFLLDALRRHGGLNLKTCAWLGISRRALYDKMRDHGLVGEASAMRTEAEVMAPAG